MSNVELDNFKRVSLLISERRKKVMLYSQRIKKGKFYCSTDSKLKEAQGAIDIYLLNKYYISKRKTIHALKNISLTINQGEFVFIKGKSGSGKTTLMNIMCGLIKPTSGDVFINNYNMAYASDNLASIFRSIFFGFVFQSHNLIHLLTLRENIHLASDLLTKAKQKKFSARKIFGLEELCTATNLDMNLLDKYPYEVSSGQLQRANIVRAMINNPPILLCDEPTSSLDKTLTLSTLELLKDINTNYQTTIVFITHDEEICKLGDKVISISDGEIKSITHNPNPEIPKLEDW